MEGVRLDRQSWVLNLFFCWKLWDVRALVLTIECRLVKGASIKGNILYKGVFLG